MRIVFLMWRDTSHPEGGGSEVFVEEISARLAAAGHDVTISCAAHENAPADEVRGGVHIRRRGSRLGVYLRGLAYLLGAGRGADIVVDVQNGLPFFSPLVRRKPIVVLLHHVHREQWQIIYPGWRGRIGWWIESRLSPALYRSRRYVTVSDASRQDMALLGIGPERVDIVHNGIDVPHPDHTIPRSVLPTICVLGRLVPHKQVEHALAVAATIRQELPDLRMDIAGEGWWHEPLAARAEELGVSDIVTFHGRVSDAQRGEILDRCWLLLAPSVKEGWGIAIMEAAARGVPAIAYRSGGGVRESVQDWYTGRLVDDLDALTKVTAELLVDTEQRERLGNAARERAAGFDWTSSARKFESVLEAQRLP
jgi:glycosyltransferase involved in cell wall biosynthesis